MAKIYNYNQRSGQVVAISGSIKNIISKMKNLSSLFPMRLRKAVVALRRPTAQIVNPRFTGWGMASSQKPPCTFEDVEGKYFSECNKQLVRLIECGSIDLTQFGERKNQIEWVIALQWRHYILQCTISRVIRVGNRQGKGISFSEFGVCDGLTSWFALQKASHMGYSPTIDLYDAWSAMRPVDLLPSELARVGDYAYLSLDNTKKNLKNFVECCNFIKGYLPETLPEAVDVAKLHWIHIDINNAKLTSIILDKFFANPLPGSVCLLDDYGHNGFEDTRLEIDDWISKRDDFLALEIFPTGQAAIVAY